MNLLPISNYFKRGGSKCHGCEIITNPYIFIAFWKEVKHYVTILFRTALYNGDKMQGGFNISRPFLCFTLFSIFIGEGIQNYMTAIHKPLLFRIPICEGLNTLWPRNIEPSPFFAIKKGVQKFMTVMCRIFFFFQFLFQRELNIL